MTSTSNQSDSLVVRATEKRLVKIEKDRAIFEGNYTSQWNIGNVPNGGCSLGIALSSAQEFVENIRGKTHSHILSTNVLYLNKVTSDVPFRIEFELLKAGRSTTNVEIELYQKTGKGGKEQVCIKTSAIFASFEGLRSDQILSRMTPSHDDLSVPQFPLIMNPNDRANEEEWFPEMGHTCPTVVFDKEANKRIEKLTGKTVDIRQMFFPFDKIAKEDVERHNLTTISIITDTAANINTNTPTNCQQLIKDMGKTWYPTLSLNVEICYPLPNFSLQRFVTKSMTRYMIQGQWSYVVEIWSHPNDAKRLGLSDGVKSVLLAYSQQTALVVSMAINLKKLNAKM